MTDDFLKVKEDITKHISLHGNHIYANILAKQLSYCFICEKTNKHFVLKLSDIKHFLNWASIYHKDIIGLNGTELYHISQFISGIITTQKYDFYIKKYKNYLILK